MLKPPSSRNEYNPCLHIDSVMIMKKAVFMPIGIVSNNVKAPRFGDFADEESEIVIDEKFADGLKDIETYSHIIVVYWMDRVKGYVTQHRPQGNPEVPVVGIFSCRCPQRPNPIAISTVKLLRREGNKLRVKGLDVIDGTPVLDIKPYWPQYDFVADGKIPAWVNKLKF